MFRDFPQSFEGNLVPSPYLFLIHNHLFSHPMICNLCSCDIIAKQPKNREISSSHSGEYKMTVFWGVGPFSLVEAYRRFGPIALMMEAKKYV
jgi:hypothetical protein